MAKVAILVPFRNRHQHLQEFLPLMEQFLHAKQIDFKIFVLEQTVGKPFNRGKLLNCGHVEAKKEGWNYLIFHDVDTIPIDPSLNYGPPVTARQIYAPHDNSLGGLVSAINPEFFEKVNGFSNEYWGWGYEDNDLKMRFLNCGIVPDYSETRFRKGEKDPEEIKKTKEKDGFMQLGHIHSFFQEVKETEGIDISHESLEVLEKKFDSTNKTQHTLEEFKRNPERQWQSGLNTLNYRIVLRHFVSDKTEWLQLEI